MKILIENAEYKIQYLIRHNVNVYDPKLKGYFYDRRYCLTKDKKGNPIPNPYFKPYEKLLVPFHWCYFLYAENTGFPFDSDFDIGFNWAEIDFEDTVAQIMKKKNYTSYFILNHQLSSQSPDRYSQDDFNGLVFSKMPLNMEGIAHLDFQYGNLKTISEMIPRDVILFMKTPYFANYNYSLYYNDRLDISGLILEIKTAVQSQKSNECCP